MIQSRKPEEAKIENLMFTTDHPGLFVQVTLNRTLFRRADQIRPLVHTASLPTIVVGYSVRVRRNIDPETGKSQFNYFTLSNYRIKTSTLGPPYLTNCLDYASIGIAGGKRECFLKCMTNDTIRKFGKVFFSDAIDKPVDLQIVSRDLIENNSTSSEFQASLNGCDSRCSRPDCNDYFYVTEATVVAAKVAGILFRVEAPRHLFYSTVYSPKITFIDFFVYISSLFGVWFGFSAWDMNPVPKFHKLRALKDRKKREKEVRRMQKGLVQKQSKGSKDQWFARNTLKYMGDDFSLPYSQFYVNCYSQKYHQHSQLGSKNTFQKRQK